MIVRKSESTTVRMTPEVLNMKILMIGGTGLLGSAGARELIKRGHEVRSIALPPLP